MIVRIFVSVLVRFNMQACVCVFHVLCACTIER